MKRSIIVLMLVVLASALSTASTQSTAFQQFLNRFLGSQERLHRGPIGPYDVTVEGRRVVGDAFLKVFVARDGGPLPEGSTVTVELMPPADLPGWARYETVRQGDAFVVDPVELVTPGRPVSWITEVQILEPGNSPVESRFGLYVYPAKPDAPRFFSVISVLLPLLAIGAFGLAAFLRKAPLVVEAEPKIPG